MLSREFVLPHAVSRMARDEPDRVVVQQVAGPTLTAAKLDSTSRSWAAALRAVGVSEGDMVATLLPNSFDAYFAWLGPAWLRAVEVPINNAHQGEMLRYLLNNCKARVLITSNRFLERVDAVAEELRHLDVVLLIEDDAPTSALPTRPRGEWLGDTAPLEGLDGPAHYDTAATIYTSGTTGPSKGVLVPWAQFYQSTTSMPLPPRDEPEINYGFYPPFHVSGKNGLYGAVVRRGLLVLRETFSLGQFWHDVRTYGCNTTAMGGPVANLLFAQPERADDADTPLQRVLMGPLIPEVAKFEQRFGVQVGTAYGMTEIGLPFASDGWTVHDPKSCGRLRGGYPGFEARVVDEHDEPVPVGDVGELIVRSAEPWALNAGYFEMPEHTARAWRNGWFHTGDAFRLDEEGNYFFVDRLKDTIRRRGENISSFEVENAVSQHPAVLETAAIGVPSELGEDDVKVCIVLRPGASLVPEDLIAFLSSRMARFMLPRFVEIVEALPKTEATSRTRKEYLRQAHPNQCTWDREHPPT